VPVAVHVGQVRPVAVLVHAVVGGIGGAGVGGRVQVVAIVPTRLDGVKPIAVPVCEVHPVAVLVQAVVGDLVLRDADRVVPACGEEESPYGEDTLPEEPAQTTGPRTWLVREAVLPQRLLLRRLHHGVHLRGTMTTAHAPLLRLTGGLQGHGSRMDPLRPKRKLGPPAHPVHAAGRVARRGPASSSRRPRVQNPAPPYNPHSRSRCPARSSIQASSAAW